MKRKKCQGMKRRTNETISEDEKKRPRKKKLKVKRQKYDTIKIIKISSG